MEYIIIIILLIYTRVLLPFLLPPFTGGDIKFHYLWIKEIKENKYCIPKFSRDNYLLKTHFRYPVLYHYIISFFPEKCWLLISKVSGLIFDGIYLVIIYLSVTILLPGENAFYALLLFVTIPQLVYLDNRAHSLSPRPLGEIFLTIALLFLYKYLESNTLHFLIISIFSGALIFPTSKGAAQGLLLFTILLTILLKHWAPLILLISSFILAFFISGGKYWGMFQSHMIQFKMALKRQKSSGIGLKKVFPNIKALLNSKTKKELIQNLIYEYKTSTIFLVTVNNLVFIFVLPGLFMTDIPVFFQYWLIAGIISFILVHFWPFQIIGGPERYIEYITLPIILIAITHLSPLYIVTISSISFIIISINFLTLFKNPRKLWRKYRENQKVIDFLNALEPSRLLPVPHRWGVEFGYKTKHQVLTWGGMQWDDINYSLERLGDFCPSNLKYFRNDLNYLIDLYDINYVVLVSDLIEDYQFPKNDVVFQGKFFAVYKVAKL